MLESILTFLTDKHTIICGATATIAEVIVIIVNAFRRSSANTPDPNKPLKLNVNSSALKNFLWCANPLNLFRLP